MLTDRGRRVGVGRWGTKALGGVTEFVKNCRKSVCVKVHWEVSSFFGRPGYMCWFEGYSKHTVTPSLSPCVRPDQQPGLCADCSVWVLRLWMLAVAMCHVLCILSLFVSSINTPSVHVGFIQLAVCLLCWGLTDVQITVRHQYFFCGSVPLTFKHYKYALILSLIRVSQHLFLVTVFTIGIRALFVGTWLQGLIKVCSQGLAN